MPKHHWSQIQVKLALCGRLRCDATWRRERAASQRLSDHELWLIWAGKGRMQTHAGNWDLRPGFCAWMRPGGVYDAQTHPRDRLGITYIHFDLYQQSRGHTRKLAPSTSAGHEFHDLTQLSFVDAVCHRVVALVNDPHTNQHHPQQAASDLLRGLLNQLEQWASTQQSTSLGHEQHKQMQAIASRLRANPINTPPVTELARQSGYSATHFHDLFKTVHGMSPQAYVIAYRIEQARHLLKESDQSVSQIAYHLGYRDVFFFSRQFKSQTGKSPLAYRREPTVS